MGKKWIFLGNAKKAKNGKKNDIFEEISIFFPFLAFPGYPFFFHFFFGWEKISIFPTYGHCAPQISIFCDFRPPCRPPHITFSCFLSLVFQRIEFPNKHFQEHYFGHHIQKFSEGTSKWQWKSIGKMSWKKWKLEMEKKWILSTYWEK